MKKTCTYTCNIFAAFFLYNTVNLLSGPFILQRIPTIAFWLKNPEWINTCAARRNRFAALMTGTKALPSVS